VTDHDRPGSSSIEPGSLFAASYPKHAQTGSQPSIHSLAWRLPLGSRLGSDMLLNRRPGTADAPPPAEFDLIPEGYAPDQVQRYLHELTAWAHTQARRAHSAEDMLRAALEQLQRRTR
jgi:hypothetical protein